eukprot:CAMPEP_0168377946 /NCGR_PEP_ID=MMETSP0228-20121227/11085_1 /TAXON_ID=133427 /ORGANISM="Protoceratium reticulatum, Strain CCCM 535 (=CCMP 1889)" /LENGTH=323 /DNA_ID=CAMNT_0008390953 /DNA_START=53 /DNA_END=1024 /DNA_ORIENTATION=-
MKLRMPTIYLLLQVASALRERIESQAQASDTRTSTTLTKAFVTFLSGDSYIPGVQALATSLYDNNASWPFIVVTTDEPSQEAKASVLCLRAAGMLVDFVQLPRVENPARHGHAARYARTYDKLDIFALPLDRVVFLDADMVVLKNIDKLFDSQTPLQACPDCGVGCGDGRFNSGMLALSPNQTIYRDMMDNLNKYESYDGGDQGFLNSYFSNAWKQNSTKLPSSYNKLKRRETREPGFKLDDNYAIHNVGIKPWKKGDPDGKTYPLCHGAFHKAQASYQETYCKHHLGNKKSKSSREHQNAMKEHRAALDTLAIAWAEALKEK